MKRILHVVGARPNFMKIAPIVHEVNNHPREFEQMLVHTGQHYDANMSKIFFDELDLPKPDLNLEVGSGSHAQQTAQMMQRLEPVLLDYKPDWVIVPGDVNSTLACTLVASKLGNKVAHVEAGLRSFDRTMPEEINRILTDQISDLLFTPSRDADENLLREGIAQAKIHSVGNVMIDTLVQLLPKAHDRWSSLQSRMGLSQYALVTLHRPSNVDNPQILREILQALESIAEQIDIIFPVHPRTRQRIAVHQLLPAQHKITLLEPLGYLDFLALQLHAAFVLTDSGGVQEETTYLGIPCLTARPNTERPVTITTGTNQLVESSYGALVTAVEKILTKPVAAHWTIPELWDGCTAKRIVEVLASCHGCG
ncbi:MAG: UDP-N-acetylglucosamine 2-epimerase (non-hydrolyzing) [Caldilineaceae bacterium]